jgi:hypothetical protein
MPITVQDITSYMTKVNGKDHALQCPCDITINIVCPSEDKGFIGHTGCGKLIKIIGVSGGIPNVGQIRAIKDVAITCPECSYVFNPYEDYI